MKLSVNWLKEFTTIDMSVDDLVEKIGSQLGAVEEVINLGERYQGIVVAKVVSCEKHPNADKLSLCTIDDGSVVKDVARNEQGLVEVVCGAPNVVADMLVAWLPPGSTVPNSFEKDKFVLEAREIRGKVSNGMLASAHELAIGDDHSGIISIDLPAKPGDDFAKLYKLDDYIIDIENKMFTHRPDCFGMLGLAREVSGISHLAFHSPEWYKQAAADAFHLGAFQELELEVVNELPELVPRFTAVAMAGAKVKPSPLLMQSMLARVGLRPINNLVDITNFVMMLTAQPVHAYDYDKLKAASNGKAVLKAGRPSGDKFIALNGKTYIPHEDDIMIKTDQQDIGFGGMIGGANTEVSDLTKNIVLECANFDMYAIRRSSMRHGIFTDAVARFNKGQSPLQNTQVIAYAVGLVRELAEGQVAGPLFDDPAHSTLTSGLKVDRQFINNRLGLDLASEEIAELLRNVEFGVMVDGDSIDIQAPFWRTDIHIREDVVEEVGRLYGYDHLPKMLPKRDLRALRHDELIIFKDELRDLLSRMGCSEVVTYSFVHEALLRKAGQDPAQAFHIRNAKSPDLQYYRLSLTPNLLEKIHPNIKAGFGQFALFEIGKSHIKDQLDDEKLPVEFERLAIVFAADAKTQKSQYQGAAYYQAKYLLNELLRSLGISAKWGALEIDKYDDATRTKVSMYQLNRAARLTVDGTVIAEIGEYNQSARSGFKLPAMCAGFEVDIEALYKARNKSSRYEPINRFPSTEQDICLKVASTMTYQELADFIGDQLEEAKSTHGYRLHYKAIDIYQSADDADHKQITFRITLEHPDRTLTDQEVNELLNHLAEAAKSALAAERI